MLDLGAGQRLIQMTYFGFRGNDVIGIDRDVVVQGFRPMGYIRMVRVNGTKRALKTLLRKLFRIDAAYRSELVRQLGPGASPRRRETVHQMDAGHMTFADESFDFVYSFRVFQHVENPRAVAREMARVVRPRGAAYAELLPYTAANGCLDLRMLAGRSDELPLWPHLRPAFRNGLQESAYLNRLRIGEWRVIFEEAMPGCEFEIVSSESEELRRDAEHLQAVGELREFTLEELLAIDVRVFWRRADQIGAQ